MNRLIGALGLGVAVAVGSGPAAAQTPPVIDLKGTWKGKGEGILEGATVHSPGHAQAQPAGKYRLRAIDFTFKVEGQEGRRFWGTVTSEHAADTRWIGSVSPDGKWIYVVGHSGFGDASIVDGDTFQMCFRDVKPTLAIVGCSEVKRQK